MTEGRSPRLDRKYCNSLAARLQAPGRQNTAWAQDTIFSWLSFVLCSHRTSGVEPEDKVDPAQPYGFWICVVHSRPDQRTPITFLKPSSILSPLCESRTIRITLPHTCPVAGSRWSMGFRKLSSEAESPEIQKHLRHRYALHYFQGNKSTRFDFYSSQ